jgi:two-component system sensor histidine kinase KdpD
VHVNRRCSAALTDPVPAGYVLPGCASALLVLGAASTQTHAPGAVVLTTAAVVVGVCGVVGAGSSAAVAAAIAWLTVSGFSRAPYAHLQPHGAAAAWVLALTAAGGLLGGYGVRSALRFFTRRSTLHVMPLPGRIGPSLGRARQLGGLAFAGAGLPALTVVLVAARPRLHLVDDLLLFLFVVVLVTLVGGFWSAVLAAVAAGLLLNWFFVLPLHTFAVDQWQNLLALLLFVAVAVAVSSVVHLAARRQGQAHAAGRETDALLGLARTVLAGADTPTQILEHLRLTLGVAADLSERSGGRWATVATAGDLDLADVTALAVRDGLLLRVSGTGPDNNRLLAAFAAQASAALDRDRLRAQAAQAEALAAGNRMRTALLSAVSHDLRTPLASVKAAVSSLRQDDITWSAADETALLATIEESADRLDALIGNLLDMSRLQTGALRPYLRHTSLEEVAPLALAGLDGAGRVVLEMPDDLPLVLTDPGLLDRVLGNVVANALRFSPAERPPEIEASLSDGSVVLTVVDHGPGVPPASRELIFEPFQRLGDAGTGIGLGLAVAKGFCDAMGIPMDVRETPGGGLTLALTLRIATTAVSADAS